MINTQKLRDLIRQACPLPWTLATSNSYRRIVRTDRYEEVCSPVKMPDGHPDLWFRDGFEGPNAQLLLGAVNALPELLDRADRVEALNVIVQSVAAALARHGVTDADDPGEAIDVLVADKDREIARLREALRSLARGYVNTLEFGRDRIKGLGGDCDPVDVMEANDPHLRAARAALQEASHD